MGGKVGIVALVMMVMALSAKTVEAQQFSLVHKYAHLEGSPANSGGQGTSPEYFAMLRAHDCQRLAAVNFPLRGDVASIGLYFTQILLGTPPRRFNVQVDTGSVILWLNCAPCPNCPVKTTIPGITLQQYDRSKTSTDKVLQCGDANCKPASIGAGNGQCTSAGSLQGCAYSIEYGDGSSTNGYFVNDVLTFQNSPNSNDTANIFFGCGTNQTGNLNSSISAVDGLMGFGPAPIAVLSQLAAQGKVGEVFAHCLEGDSVGGGSLVIGNISEPDISYTPLVNFTQFFYNVGLQNIAVNGVNVTTPKSFEITLPSNDSSLFNEGVVVDSGTTLAYLTQPAYDQFVAAISDGTPASAPLQNFTQPDNSTVLCSFFSGDIASSFPSVKLFFDGGAVMNLAPTNYLLLQSFTNGTSGYCLSWFPSEFVTILGDIVLKDQIVVYDNDKRRLGWKPFNCTKPIPVA